MNLLLTIRIALRALRKNKMRGSLTVLGVVIGIAAVTTMVSVGQSAGKLLQSQVESLGTNVIWVFSTGRRHGPVRHGRGSAPTLTAEDAEAIAEECPTVLATSPLVFTAGQVIYGNVNWPPQEMFGVGTDYLIVRNWPIRRGAFFSESDVASAAKVCVIGHTVAAKLFQTSDPLGEQVRIRNIPFEVIGVLEEKGANLFGEDQDNVVFMPYTTVSKRLQGSSFEHVHLIMVSARSIDGISQAQQDLKILLCERHDIPPGDLPDFESRSTSEIVSFLGKVTGIMTALLASIAGISLVVGGVGIMNIMLVSVTERTREIGIRMAVGARGGNILWQFLVEAVLLSGIGGIVGFGLGAGASVGITKLINSLSEEAADWPVVVSVWAGLAAMVTAGAVGVFFGLYPAWKASRLDPIDALRYE